MDSNTREGKTGTLRLVLFALGVFIFLYLLLFGAIVYTDGRLGRDMVDAGVPARLLDFLYGWLDDLLFGP